jgi:hypothetical protein
MKAATLNKQLGILVALTATFAAPAWAVDCDIVSTLANEEGALNLNGYSFGSLNGRAITGTCQGLLSMTITTMNPAITSEVGDGVARRKLSAFEQLAVNPAGQQVPSLIARFQIVPPELPLQAAVRELKIRDMVFTQTEDGGLAPGHLSFVLRSTSGGLNWKLIARMNYAKYPSNIEINYGDISLPAGQQSFDVLVDYKRAAFLPSLKLTYFRADGTTVLWSKQANLSPGMYPISQSQGLLQQTNMLSNQKFTVFNCIGNICSQ